VLEESEKSGSQGKQAHLSPGFEITFKVSKSMQLINFSDFLNELFYLWA